MDFVSPRGCDVDGTDVDNVKRCQELTNDFRKENFARVWKDDVLQLYNVLWWVRNRLS